MPSRSSRNNHARKTAHRSATDSNTSDSNADNTNDDANRIDDGTVRERRRHNRRRQSPPSVALTPPTHLPTPLPDERLSLSRSHSQRHAAGLGLLDFAGADDDDGNGVRDAALSRLIDFDTPTPPPALLASNSIYTNPNRAEVEEERVSGSLLDDIHQHEREYEHEHEYDGGGSRTVYRSPPYREAPLPSQENDNVEESPPPLPVLPRYPQQQALILNDDDDGNMDGRGAMQGGFAGHVRAPTFAGGSISSTSPNTSRSPAIVSPSPSHSRYSSGSGSGSTFDALTRTIRGYAAPSAPRVSKPVSYANFSPPAATAQGYGHGRTQSLAYGGPAAGGEDRRQEQQRASHMQQEFERDYEREYTGDGTTYYGYGYPTSPPPLHPAALPHSAPRGQGHGQPPSQQYTQYDARASAPTHSRSYSQPVAPTPSPAPSAPQASRFMGSMGSGLAQAIRRGAAAGVGVVSGRAAVGRGVGGARRGVGEAMGVDGKDRMKREEEGIVWARWDCLNGRRVLLIAYPSALQMWDCADLSALREVFNIDLGTREWALMLGGGSLENVSSGQKGLKVVHAAVLPDPVGIGRRGEKGKDTMSGERPLLGMMLESADDDARELEVQSVFVVYSLRTHQVVKMRPLPGFGSRFEANEKFIVVATTTPATLHILSSTTFHTLHTIASDHLEPFATPSLSTSTPSTVSITNAISSTAQSTSASLGIDIGTRAANTSGDSGKLTPDAPPEPPHPVFALHHRLLAYASPSPASSPSIPPSNAAKDTRRLSSSSASSAPSNAPSGSSLSSSPFGFGGKISAMTQMTQADVGHAALKVGESVFSGMRFLGGMALEAAKNRVVGPEGRVGAFGSGAAASIPVGQRQRAASGSPGTTRERFVSRSAPDTEHEEEALRERRYSNTSNLSAWDQQQRTGGGASGGSTPNSPNPHLTTIAPSTRPVADNGHYITVIDLAPLLSGAAGVVPAKIDEFNVSRSKSVVELSWSNDGTSVAAALKDGHTTRVFKIQPTPRVLLAARAAALETASTVGGFAEMELRSEVARRATHVYDLYRGRTFAVVDGLGWAKDGRWMAMGTRNRTIHVFAVNPYGGPSDVKSHVEGRMRNVDVVEPPSTTLYPLVRLRGAKTGAEQGKVPLAFTFISPSDVTSSPTLMFPFVPPPISHSPSFSPPKLKRGKNYQDLLVFDPTDGVLSLRRLAIDKQLAKEHGIGGGVAASVHALAVTSISLPGMGGAGRLSFSPSTRGGAVALSGGRSTSGTKVEEPELELIGKESTEATWNLRRGRDWLEIKTPVSPVPWRSDVSRRGATNVDWLAEGEISTCSTSTRVLPRSLYLSHQFSFHTLGEDYHALIRRYQFDISGVKIEVRKAVEISAYASGGGESAFVEGFSSPRDIRRASSSFDEPIASAISGSFDNSKIPTVLPMYPNGVPGSKPKSFRNSIPIRTMTGIGDGVTEGIGRIRREMHKTRSPQLVAHPDSFSGSVPLEFDEEDEDFLARDALKVSLDRGDSSVSRDTSREGVSGDSASSLVTPANLSTQHLMDADVVGTMEEDLWDGWDRQDKLAVEEAEQFHDITAVGYVEEEQPQIAVVSDQAPSAKRKGRAKRRG